MVFNNYDVYSKKQGDSKLIGKNIVGYLFGQFRGAVVWAMWE